MRSHIAASLTRGQVLPCKIAGYLRVLDQPVETAGAPVFELQEMLASFNSDVIDDIVIALPSERIHELDSLLPILETLSVPTRLAIDLAPAVATRDQLIDLGGVRMLDLRPTLAESGSYLIQKRIVDIVLSVLTLAVVWPAMFLIALLIKLESRGPVFFAQERVGLNGHLFRMLKFRTMRVGSTKRKRHSLDSRAGPAMHARRRFSPQASLDELPQFLNVLKGEMSIVGPRPERPFFVKRFLKEFEMYHSRHFFRAGITGWAQVNGWRGDTSIAKRVEYDLYYLRNWSLTFDLQIITLTFFRFFSGKNAY